MSGQYKFENFKNRNFPVYSSIQKGPGTLVVPHFHGAAELVRIQKGKVRGYINTQCLYCEQGDILYIPPMCIHSIVSDDPETELQGIVFDFSLIPSGFAELQKVLNRDVVNRFLITEQCDTYASLDSCMSDGFRVYAEETVTYELEMLSVIYKMTALLLRHYCTTLERREHFSRLQPVIDYIRGHFRQSISVSELSGMIHVCDDHLIRIFKLATNKTPVGYITDLRLEEAMKLLVDTDLSVTEVAYKSGFASSCYMDRVFRQRLQITPLAYRKKR